MSQEDHLADRTSKQWRYDVLFRQVTRFFAFFVFSLLAALIISLLIGSMPAIKTFGVDCPCHRRAGEFWHCAVFNRVISSLVASAIRDRHRAFGWNSQHYLWNVGAFCIRAFFCGTYPALVTEFFRECAWNWLLV